MSQKQQRTNLDIENSKPDLYTKVFSPFHIEISIMVKDYLAVLDIHQQHLPSIWNLTRDNVVDDDDEKRNRVGNTLCNVVECVLIDHSFKYFQWNSCCFRSNEFGEFVAGLKRTSWHFIFVVEILLVDRMERIFSSYPLLFSGCVFSILFLLIFAKWTNLKSIGVVCFQPSSLLVVRNRHYTHRRWTIAKHYL